MSSITQANGFRQYVCLLTVVLVFISGLAKASGQAESAELGQFKQAWEAARKGDHASFNQIKDTLETYVLYPYLQYEDYRARRARVPVDEMAIFLESHRDWAFSSGLRTAWLRSLAKKGRWTDLVAQSGGVSDTALRCQRARGQIILKQTEGVLGEAQKLWVVGKSQPDECDPVFAWLAKNNGITPSLAWERIRLVIEAGNRSLAMYLARYVPHDERRWVQEWYTLSGAGYSRLEQTRSWPDNKITQMITTASLQSLARKDAVLAAQKFQMLDSHFKWEEEKRQLLLHDIALYSAVGLEEGTTARMESVSVIYRDSQLLEWWARFSLSRQDWPAVVEVIGQMQEDTRNDDRWRYWLAQAGLRSGQVSPPSELLKE